jgi:hypothetical protein
MRAPTRRAALFGTLASAGTLALPAVAIAAVTTPDADAELIALAAEIEQLCAVGKAIYAERVDPFQETFQRLLEESLSAAAPGELNEWPPFVFSREVGREAAIKERAEVDEQAGLLWEQMMAIPAATQAGKIAKVRTLLTFVHTDEWRGPTADLDWEKEQTRALLGQFAGMSEEELAAV